MTTKWEVVLIVFTLLILVAVISMIDLAQPDESNKLWKPEMKGNASLQTMWGWPYHDPILSDFMKAD